MQNSLLFVSLPPRLLTTAWVGRLGRAVVSTEPSMADAPGNDKLPVLRRTCLMSSFSTRLRVGQSALVAQSSIRMMVACIGLRNEVAQNIHSNGSFSRIEATGGR